MKRGKQKPKPRKKWEMVTSMDFPRSLFAEKDAKEIAKNLEIHLSSKLYQKYADAVHQYLVTLRLIDNRPLHSEKRIALEILARRAGEFSEALNDLDDLSRCELYPLEWNWLDDIAAKAMMVGTRAKRAIEDLKEFSTAKRGRRPQIALISFISILLEIYTEATGKKPTISRRGFSAPDYDGMTEALIDKGEYFKSEFFSFVEKGLMKIPGHPKMSNIAIGKAIESARKNPIKSILAP